ncbi:MAG: aminotransferase class I/II-fold pyridoxal phosphate-dependent enzyme, partial [Bifidobacterium boum]|nr:aminotransferase class I/II-fold pyridoxal phosphate-dependent enzyme [Bifidobacterium boum]
RFISGGTQTNQLVIDTMLQPYEGVVAAASGHVNVHEAGAIEATGHKVLTVPQHDGLIDAGELREYCETFYADDNHEHMVFPGMVYISHPTEYGTLYTKAQLEAIAAVCHEYHMPLFIDGARLGYGLVASGTDVTLPDIARIADVFYIGGTKVGALFGEAVVFTKGNMPKHFTAQIKQHGALMAKGWLMGLQFDTLFTDGLYTRIARNADEMADRIREALRAKGYRMVYENTTNQIFVSFDHATVERLEREVRLGFMERYDDDHTVMRICTSWATTAELVDRLIDLL